MRKSIMILAGLSLSACGGVTTSASPPLSPVSPSALTNGIGGTLGGTVQSGDAPGPVSSITHSGTPFVGVIKLAPTGSAFGQAQLVAGSAFDVLAFSDDGKATATATSLVSATLIASSTASAAGFGQRAIYSRDTASVLPSGTGTYSGEYRGSIGGDGVSYAGQTAGAIVGITGTSTLNVNFGSNTVSGSITNRQTLLSAGPGAGLGNVTLSSSSLTGNAQFAGSASSGGVSGTYEGLIGGANGTGTAGALRLNHAGGVTEIGVFTAVRTGP